MNFVLVTLLALGAEPVPPGASNLPPPQAMGEMGYEDCNCEACRAGRGGPGIAARVGAAYQHLAYKVATCAMEPQTNYNPRYGCYGSNDRFMHRYPAFHGYYYRRPYNYRNQFDYPWHAELHEPTSLFSYNFPNEGEGPGAGPGPRPPEPLPRTSRRDPQAGNGGGSNVSRPTTMKPVSVRPVKSAYTIKSEEDPSDEVAPSPSDRR